MKAHLFYTIEIPTNSVLVFFSYYLQIHVIYLFITDVESQIQLMKTTGKKKSISYFVCNP